VTDEPPPQSLSKAEAADRLKVSVRTLHRLLQTGELEGVRDGPKGGLRPTRASVERRLEQLEGATRAHEVEAQPVAAETPAPETTGDRSATRSRKERAPTAVSSARPPRGGGLVRSTRRVGARLLRRGGGHVMRALRHVAKRPARAARCVIAAALIAGLVALGATRERSGAAASRGDVTVLLITSHDGKARHRTRLRCRATSGEPVKIYVRRGRRARCTPPRGGRAAP
jgi:excisionase family DNA binding protein